MNLIRGFRGFRDPAGTAGTTGINTINTKKPLTPLNKSEEQLTDYFTVINILESIQTPISKGVLSNGIRWTINGTTYSHSKDSSGKSEINKPLLINY